jgi:uncharacterized protein (DUF362 family)
MKRSQLTRREFLSTSKDVALGAVAGSIGLNAIGCDYIGGKPVVSVARIQKDRIDTAVERAIDLLGGMGTITAGREKIMLKPNLVNARSEDTTNPEVVRTLATLMKKAGKNVLIGEGSAAATGFNVKDGASCRTKKREILDPMQRFVFDQLGYTEMGKSMDVPLLNLHSGEIAEVDVPGAFAFPKVLLHRSLTEIDLLCSVPMMKTHGLASVTLGIKNLVGVFPGTAYYSVRWGMHETASVVDPSGTSAAIVDMARANRLGLVVIDGSMAMEGQGPSVSYGGKLVKMDVIVAGTNPLATDMVGAHLMGFEPDEISTFRWAWKAGMKPTKLEDIEIRSEEPVVGKAFARPEIFTWASIRDTFGARVL